MPAIGRSVGLEGTTAQLGSLAQLAERGITDAITTLTRRVKIPYDSTAQPEQIAEGQEDPWQQAGKYALGWVYFSIILLILTVFIRLYHTWTDKIRTALHKEEVAKSSMTTSPDSYFEMGNLPTSSSVRQFFPRTGELPYRPKKQSSVSSFGPLNNGIALVRWFFYRPLPIVSIKKREFGFPALGVIVIAGSALIFVTLYCLLPTPLYYSSMAVGSPPLAIRAGMLSVAMMPWIVALSMKANMVSMLTGIGHERLNVLHRWGGYLCLFLALLHTVPFYVQPLWDQGGFATFQTYFTGQTYVYATGIAALVPLIFLCVASLPIIRRRMYELFVALHVPVAILFLGMMFWHCHNYLTSWNYLFATLAIWLISYCIRVFYLNWTNPWRMSWLIGEEAAVTILPENAVKVTIPTQTKWRPGQYVYLRMPGISVFENHPFTIASLCSDDFPSEYGEQYRDMTLVFRPFGGFTRKVFNVAMEKGPEHTYRAFIDGPYGGMQREMASFDTVILFAGGSGITAIVSQLLDLIKRMRDGKAVTKNVQVVWALKRPDTVHWFQEELRICREFAPPDTVHCQFFITAAKRQMADTNVRASRPLSGTFHEKLNDAFQGIASKRNSALIHEEAAGDPERMKELRRENEDGITALPRAHLAPAKPGHARSKNPNRLSISVDRPSNSIDFGFPSTPTMLQKNLMRFAFLPAGLAKKDGWRTEYGRPDVPYMLKQFSRDFGRRTCVFVCGPPSMRIDVATSVAALQRDVWADSGKDEIFLHTENYAI